MFVRKAVERGLDISGGYFLLLAEFYDLGLIDEQKSFVLYLGASLFAFLLCGFT